MIDEASQVSTADMARIMSLALQAGARVDPVGDTRQLGPVEAGGMFPLIAKRIGNWAITGVRRFAEAWEREASLRLREGDVMALGDYQAHGRIYDGPQDRVYDDAVDLYMADVALGKSSLLLASTNAEAAQLARMVRERRIERGQITGAREVTLSDGNAGRHRRPGAGPAQHPDRRGRAAAHEPGHAAPGRLPGNRESPHRDRRAADRPGGVVRAGSSFRWPTSRRTPSSNTPATST